YDSREKSESANRSSFQNIQSGKIDKADAAEYKTVYKGRGKDQKPRFESVRKDAVGQKRPGKKFFTNSRFSDNGPTEAKPSYDFKKYEKNIKKNEADDEIRLNKYIANSGVCSRREADSLIENGLISVNGQVIKELGHKVTRKDTINYQGRTL